MIYPWSDQYLTGNPTIDAEHRAIFDLDRLWNSLEAHNMESYELILHSVTEHFAHEESMMQALTGEQIEAHKASHRRLQDMLVAKTRLLMTDHSEMVNFVAELIRHIQNYDVLLCVS